MRALRNIVIFFVIVASAAISIYINRSLIFNYSANKLIKNLLPVYTEVKNLDFDFENNRVTIKDFKVLNPEGFERTCLIRIPEVNAIYGQRDKKNILKGVVISDIVLFNPVISLNRSKDGKTNIRQIAEIFRQAQRSREIAPYLKLLGVLCYLASPVEKTYNLKEIKETAQKRAELIEIKPVINVKDGTFIFDDRYTYPKGYKTTIEEINARIILKLKKDLKGLDYIESVGSGFINGQRSQTLGWVITSDPKTPELTMSNALKIQNVNLLHFRPYYDKFSPFVFERGRASGKLNFNFANGNIDSMNELRIATPKFKIKEDFPFKDLWAVSAQDLDKYFTSQSGEIFFDFEIKGPTQQPRFSIGPRVKIALAKMVADKIADILLEETAEAQDKPKEEKGLIQRIVEKYKKLRASDETQPQPEAQDLP